MLDRRPPLVALGLLAIIASACSSPREASVEDTVESSSSLSGAWHHGDGGKDGGGGPCAAIGFPVVETMCPYGQGDSRCAGWECEIEFPTPGAGGERHEQFWTDTDGVRPEIPGCHQEWRTSRCDDHDWLHAEFGEACVGDLLIETNPAAGVCHPHERATSGPFEGEFVGHPDVYSCEQFCTQTGHDAGKCVMVQGVSCPDGAKIASAKCDCTDHHDGGGPDAARDDASCPL